MKKIVIIASLMLAFAGINFAQTTPATPPAKKAKTTKTTPATATTPAAAAKPATAAAGPTKKDGTPDMRYKANKDAAKTPPVHLKKDGTPDKRYKENKPKKTS
ncbi:MAG TPA: hypothetical protein VF939_19930 [Puia sp.]